MPTFNNPSADAREAFEAVRGLAHATQRIENPEVLYPVIGDLMATTRNLSQVLDQLARAHQQHAGRAMTDAGDRDAGNRLTVETAAALREAAAQIGQTETVLDRASQKAGQIAWKPDEPQHRWVSIVFLQGEEADTVIEIINWQGTDAAIEYLSGWDYGEETVNEAMENGYVYDTAPLSAADRLATSGDYALTYSSDLGYVGLSRRIDAPTPEPERELAVPTVEAGTGRRGAGRHRGTERPEGGSWFLPDAIAEVAENRGLSL